MMNFDTEWILSFIMAHHRETTNDINKPIELLEYDLSEFVAEFISYQHCITRIPGFLTIASPLFPSSSLTLFFFSLSSKSHRKPGFSRFTMWNISHAYSSILQLTWARCLVQFSDALPCIVLHCTEYEPIRWKMVMTVFREHTGDVWSKLVDGTTTRTKKMGTMNKKKMSHIKSDTSEMAPTLGV